MTSELANVDPSNNSSVPTRLVTNSGQRVGMTEGLKLPYPLWSYAAVGCMLLAGLVWFFVLITLRTISRQDYWSTEGWFVGWGWAGFTTAAMSWGLVNVHWAKRAFSELKFTECFAHWALAIAAGSMTLGIHYVSYVRSQNEGVQIVDPKMLLPAESLVESLGGPIYGRASRGKAWFAYTCSTCHGPTGEGINNLAPSLKDSEFLKTASPVEINLLIRRGRSEKDPANKSGKAMPARGNDKTITDEKLADLVAFVMSLHSRTADPATLSWEGVESPPPTMSARLLKIRAQNPTVRRVSSTSLLIHGCFLAVVMASSVYLLLGGLRGWQPKRLRGWMFVSAWGWLVALVAWLSNLAVLGMMNT